MPIETPYLSTPLDTSIPNYGDQEVFNRNLSSIVDGTNQLTKALGDAKLQGIKKDFGDILHSEELQFRKELGDQLAASNVAEVDLLGEPGVTEATLKTMRPEVKTLLALDARDKQGVQQGFLDANDYQIRAEARMREYLVRYPHLQDELLGVAQSAGGFGLIPADLQATFEDIKAIQSAEGKEDSEVKRLKGISKEHGVDQTLYTTNPTEYWTQTLRFSEANQSLAALDLQWKQRQTTGNLKNKELAGELNRAVPGMAASAWAKSIQPTILSSLGISNINNFDPEKYNPVALDSIKQELQNKKASFLAESIAKYGRTGDVDAADIKTAIQPVLDMFDAADARLGSKSFAQDMTNHVNTLMGGAIATMPNGIQLKVYSDMVRGMDQSFASDQIKRDVSMKLGAAMVSLFANGTPAGQSSNFGEDGQVLPFARTNPIKDLDNDPSVSDADLQKGAISFIRQVKSKIQEFGQNKDPSQYAVTRDAAIQTLRMFTDYYNDDAIKATKGAISTNVANEIIALGATEEFKQAFEESPPDLQEALAGTFLKTTQAEYDQVMRGEVNQDAAKLLANVNQITPTPVRIPGAMPFQVDGPVPPIVGDIAKTAPVVFTIASGTGQAFFVPDNLIVSTIRQSSLSTPDKDRAIRNISNAANELTAKYGGRLTNLIKMGAHVTPGFSNMPQPYAASFEALALSLQAQGNLNIQIDESVAPNGNR